ncbi:hypothetical protein F2Q70_00005994 [Brassica cretica]|uniref:Uncharacterized protein n=1 Tax=Brassica cretica TaxID=69181 RepID=A0A8S9IS03_BRACR|nr:hypothetical protein F2Q70_00005994 [Brassica cretica]
MSLTPLISLAKLKQEAKTIPPPSALPQLSSTSTPLSRSFSTAAAVVCVDQSPDVKHFISVSCGLRLELSFGIELENVHATSHWT